MQRGRPRASGPGDSSADNCATPGARPSWALYLKISREAKRAADFWFRCAPASLDWFVVEMPPGWRDVRGMRDRASRRGPVLIKQYANRRLYNTESATYMSLDDVSAMLRHGRSLVVREAETGQDITDAVLERLPWR
jgi:hypothetical protein